MGGKGKGGGWGSCDPTAPRPASQAGETHAYVPAHLPTGRLRWDATMQEDVHAAPEHCDAAGLAKPLGDAASTNAVSPNVP